MDENRKPPFGIEEVDCEWKRGGRFVIGITLGRDVPTFTIEGSSRSNATADAGSTTLEDIRTRELRVQQLARRRVHLETRIKQFQRILAQLQNRTDAADFRDEIYDLQQQIAEYTKELEQLDVPGTRQRAGVGGDVRYPSFGVGSSGCEDGYWIQTVSSDGRVIVLNDDSVWEVDSLDRLDSQFWMSYDDVIVCDDQLINLDEEEFVEVARIR